jgi:hypothetical protein
MKKENLKPNVHSLKLNRKKVLDDLFVFLRDNTPTTFFKADVIYFFVINL